MLEVYDSVVYFPNTVNIDRAVLNYKYWNIFNFYDVYSILTKLIENQYILCNYISIYLGIPPLTN